MNSYLNTIQDAIYFFPIIVALIILPYLYYEYKRHGKLELRRSLLSYSFLLYIICCYALIILPLPDYDTVLNSTGPYTDLRFLGFIQDLKDYTNLSLNPLTWLPTIKTVWFYEPFFNFIMLIPFGIYQRRLFNNGFIKATFYAFLLSLSFEFIQLSGLLGIYPHPYRLFQVDDIFLNTCGSVFGWLIAPKRIFYSQNSPRSQKQPFAPSIKIRIAVFIIDLIILSLIMKFLSILFGQILISGRFMIDYTLFIIAILGYYCFTTLVLGDQSIGAALLNQKYTTRKGNKIKPALFLVRQVLLFGLVIPGPFIGFEILDLNISKIIAIPIAIILIILPFFVGIQILLGNVPFYESYTQIYLSDLKKLKHFIRDQRASLSSFSQDHQQVPYVQHETSDQKVHSREQELKEHK